MKTELNENLKQKNKLRKNIIPNIQSSDNQESRKNQ